MDPPDADGYTRFDVWVTVDSNRDANTIQTFNGAVNKTACWEFEPRCLMVNAIRFDTISGKRADKRKKLHCGVISFIGRTKPWEYLPESERDFADIPCKLFRPDRWDKV